MRRIVLGLGLAIAATLASASYSDAQSQAGAAKMSWRVTPTITAAVTPNYQSGFGPMGGTGSGATPAPGGSAVLDGGFVDFGTLVAGYQYIYKYAAQVQVKSNDASGYKVFAEGTGEFVGSSSTLPMNSVLFWMLSGTGNTQYSAATPFSTTNNTGDTPTNGGNNVTFASGPPSSTLIYSSSSQGTSTQGFDYQIHVPPTVSTDTFTATVVYTAVAN